MADHYQDRPLPTDADHDRGANPYVRGESDPLAVLAQLTGQTDPFGTPAKSPFPLQSRANVRPQYAPAEEEASAPRWAAAMEAACQAGSPATAGIRVPA